MKTKKDDRKLFIVRKYVMAVDAQQAIKLAKDLKPDDVYVSDEWKQGKNAQLASAIGFVAYEDTYEKD